ncbi:phage antirepressor KilAC domain-containing protein [Comamonas sp. C11]|uniref:phage antirepressor KilAC domain-containing protein n=1 Tax=Comamonas sp. C11 TaxID=2966554 RepID=UPI0021122680|nr:phage antirepressor KilAC domain-containing protein [Comamonas sp. C11]UUC95572.1 phage antirepressor KilAC domain-containing protein [Comamonas sp. C11]
MSLNSTISLVAVPLTMSSRDIAELTGKDHFHVMRDLRALHGQLGALFGGSIHPWIHPQNGQTYVEYLLDKDTSLTLLLGYDPVARMKVVKRWQELEAQQPAPAQLTRMDILKLAMESEQARIQAETQLALAAPKAEYVDRYVAANGSLGFRQVAKLLNAKEPEFRAFLEDSKILYRLAGVLTPYQNHIDAGRFSIKTGVSQVNEHAFNTTKFTPKGVEWVAGLWGKHKARQAQEAGVQA